MSTYKLRQYYDYIRDATLIHLDPPSAFKSDDKGYNGEAHVDLTTAYLKGINFGACEKLPMESVDMGDKIQNIGFDAFRDCKNLQSVHFSENSTLTSIDKGAFSGCKKLEDFSFPKTVESIGEYAFNETAIRTADLSNVKEVGHQAFYNSQLREVTISSETQFGRLPFAGCEQLEVINIKGENVNAESIQKALWNVSNDVKLVVDNDDLRAELQKLAPERNFEEINKLSALIEANKAFVFNDNLVYLEPSLQGKLVIDDNSVQSISKSVLSATGLDSVQGPEHLKADIEGTGRRFESQPEMNDEKVAAKKAENEGFGL
jgi:hypothetical protein